MQKERGRKEARKEGRGKGRKTMGMFAEYHDRKDLESRLLRSVYYPLQAERFSANCSFFMSLSFLT
jgi:hypothetical protein